MASRRRRRCRKHPREGERVARCGACCGREARGGAASGDAVRERELGVAEHPRGGGEREARGRLDPRKGMTGREGQLGQRWRARREVSVGVTTRRRLFEEGAGRGELGSGQEKGQGQKKGNGRAAGPTGRERRKGGPREVRPAHKEKWAEPERKRKAR